MKSIFLYGFIGMLGIFFLNWLSSDTNSPNYNNDGTMTYATANDFYQDEIYQFIDIDGAEVIACSEESENCYNLHADIENDCLTTLYFNNGGYLTFGDACFNEGVDDVAVGVDDDINVWEFTLYDRKYHYQVARKKWAEANGYVLVDN